MEQDLLTATTEESYRSAVTAMLANRDDGTTPDMGWPWPWDDSRTTDYAYAFEDGSVFASFFGHEWFAVDVSAPYFGEPQDTTDNYENDDDYQRSKTAVFPNMRERVNPVFGGKRSGLIIIEGSS